MWHKILIALSVLLYNSGLFAQNKSIIQEEKAFYNQFKFKNEQQWDSLRITLLGITKSGEQKAKPVQTYSTCTLTKRVFGWFPYWQGTTYTNFQWNLLSDFCYFDYTINPSTGGNSNSSFAWSTSNAVTTAKTNGNKIHICASLFSGFSTFWASSSAKTTFINNIINLLNARGGNGVNIDFEGMAAADKTSFTNFIIQLKNSLIAANPSYEVSIALYAVDWSGVFDIPSLTPYVDAFIIMGYDYYYSGSAQAGPEAPLYNFQTSYNYTLSKSITYYLNKGVPNAKLLLGLPYYGREWETTSNTTPSNTTGAFTSSRTFAYVKTNSTGYYTTANKKWEQNCFNPFYTFQVSGNWRQCWIDDAYSMGRKFDMVNQRGIGGIGIWALGYDDGYNDYWQDIQDKFSTCRVWQCTDSLFDMGGPTRNYYDNEKYTYTIYAPSPTQKLLLQFAPTFSLESNYDSLWIYNGASTAAPLIGAYTGGSNPGSVLTATNAFTIRFKSDGATNAIGFKATYQCTTTAINGPTTSVLSSAPWITATYTANFNDIAGSSPIQKAFYNAACFNGATWTANPNRGFCYDDFNTLSALWTIKTGTWNATGSNLVQTDETSPAAANTNIYEACTQTLSNRYVYHFKIKLEGSGTNRRGGFHFFCDNADSSNRNNSYFVWFRLDSQKFQLYKVINNTFSTPVVDIALTFTASTWYDVKVIFDRTTGQIWTYWNNVLISAYTDASPHTVGNYISFRSGNAKMSIDSFRVYRSRTTTPTVLVGTGNTDLMYQNPSPAQYAGKILSICQDNNNLLSNIATQTLNIDWTPPTNITIANDGPASDINIACTKDTLKANWGLSNDPNSNVVKYWYSIGTSVGATNVLNWTNNWTSNSVNVYVPSLTNGQMYYFNIKSENGAGLQSPIISTNGQQVDTSASCIATGINILNRPMAIIFPNPMNSEVIFYFNKPLVNGSITIQDAFGKTVRTINNIKTTSVTINREILSSGIYFYVIEKDNGEVLQKGKLIVE